MIPRESKVYQQLNNVALEAKCVAFSGLPGVGKSLYVNQFYQIAKELEKEVTVIQWDIARKAFESPDIMAKYPMVKGEIHNVIKLSAGAWLLDIVKTWIEANSQNTSLLVIEAPLVGHRFVELAKLQTDLELENFLSGSGFQIIMPIPSKRVREKIEEDRRAQVDESAKLWKGAKPSVMLLLWKMTCDIANEFGRSIPMITQPDYDPEVYEFVFRNILKHRHFIPLHIDEIFAIKVENEDELHNLGSLVATDYQSHKYVNQIEELYSDPEQIDLIANSWYLT